MPPRPFGGNVNSPGDVPPVALLLALPLLVLPARAENKQRLLESRVTPLEIRRKAAKAEAKAQADGDFTPLPRQPRIIGGNQASAGEYPWMAALVSADEPDNFQGQFCGASLIHPRWVLTAGHCVIGSKPEDIEVVLGTTNLESPVNVQRIAVAEIVLAPHFNEFNLDSDFALLRLAELANANLTPINLIDDAALANPGIMSVITGWGDTTNGQGNYPPRLQEVSLPIVDLALANASDSYQGTLTENMLAAGLVAGGKDSCSGDSGGPMIVPSPVGGGSMQAGIVSFGNGCAMPGVYGIYTNVAKFRRFITGHTRPNYAAWEVANDRNGELRDPDGNGFNNFEDFALPDHILEKQVAGDFVQFSYVRPELAGEVDYLLEKAPGAAGPWTLKSPVFVSSEEVDDGFVRWTVQLPVAENTGVFRVRAAFSSQLAEGPRPIRFPGGATGQLDGTDGDFFARDYLLQGVPAGQHVSVTFRAAGFDALLALVNAKNGDLLLPANFNRAGGLSGGDELMTFTAQPGMDYLLRIGGGVGDFELNVWDAATLAAQPVLALPAAPKAKVVKGSLAPADPFDPFFQPGGEFHKDDYRLDLSAASTGDIVEIRMKSKARGAAGIDDFVSLIDAENGRMVTGNDSFSGRANDAGFRFLPVPGKTYLLRASSAEELDFGNYSLSAAIPKRSAKTPLASLALGARAAGKLAAGSEIDDLRLTAKRDYLLDPLPAGTEVFATLESSRFDAYLIVLDATDLRGVTERDGGGPGPGTDNARVSFTTETGRRYILRATTQAEGQTGPYIITTGFNP